MDAAKQRKDVVRVIGVVKRKLSAYVVALQSLFSATLCRSLRRIRTCQLPALRYEAPPFDTADATLLEFQRTLHKALWVIHAHLVRLE